MKKQQAFLARAAVTLLAVLFCLTGVRAQTEVFNEDFEGGTMPDGWTSVGLGTWTVGTGDFESSIGAGEGTYNALIQHSENSNVTKLITPVIELDPTLHYELSFMHIQRVMGSDQDELRVYYRTSANGDWTQLAEYTSAVSSWTTEEIALPNASATYQIAFEMCDKWGRGVGIDNVIIGPKPIITDLPWSEDFDSYVAGVAGSFAPSTYPSDPLPDSWRFLNRSESSSAFPNVFLTSYSDYAVSGNCLFFRSSKDTPLYAVLPEFAEDIANLQLTFNYRNEGTSASNGPLVVGYMTDPTDATTFTTVLTCGITNTLTEKTVTFTGAPAGSYIAFKYLGNTDNYYLSIDNVKVEQISYNDVILAEDTDNTATLEAYDGRTANVTLTRTLQAGGWNTFVVPFNIDGTKMTALGITDARELAGSSLENDVLTLTFTTASSTSIVAGKPYLVQVSQTVENPTFNGVTVSGTATSAQTAYADFVPVLNPTTLTDSKDNILFVSGGNELMKPSTDGQTIYGFRGYFRLKTGTAQAARAFRMAFSDDDEETTGIRNVNENVNVNENWFDLQGRRVDNVHGTSAKGIYIRNGKKVIIK